LHRTWAIIVAADCPMQNRAATVPVQRCEGLMDGSVALGWRGSLSHRPSKRHSLPGFTVAQAGSGTRSAPNLATLQPCTDAAGRSWDTRWHQARPLQRMRGGVVQPRPLCPTSDWEVGRKKALIFLCLSNLSNLSNLFKEFIEKGECPQRIPRDFCQKGWTRWPRWTEPTTTGISRVHPRIGRLDEVRPRLDRR
jgi:hypothetical protein